MFLASAAPAADASTACPAVAEPIPATLAAWTAPATGGEGVIDVGRADRWAAHSDATFLVPPERTPAPGAFGVVLPLTLTEGGTYAVAIDQRAWIDVVSDTRTAMVSTTHGHGPACSGIVKIVRFALEPGDYAVQISGAAGPNVRILVARE